MKFELAAAFVFCALAASAVSPCGVPDLLVSREYGRIAMTAEWERTARPKIKKFFTDYVYGHRPCERPPHLKFSLAEPDRTMMDGRALRKRVCVEYGGRYGTNSFVFTAFIPASAKKRPAPSFVLICNRDPKKNIDPERVEKSEFWPAEEIVARGYAAIAFWNGDVTPDSYHGNRLGCFACFENVDKMYRRLDSWGALSAWAWAASRVMDWIETEPLLNAKHVGVVGHSRGGKTAILAGVTDERFAMTCSNCSGCAGAKLNHIRLPTSEHYQDTAQTRSFWYCHAFKKFIAHHDDKIPFDSHQLLALVAPRLLYVVSAGPDTGAGPQGEFHSVRLASPAWELYGRPGLGAVFFPALDEPIQRGCVGYHVHSGPHTLNSYDWGRYMDFADFHGWLR
jgi:hypothetical protein